MTSDDLPELNSPTTHTTVDGRRRRAEAAVIREVWVKASSGTPVGEFEPTIAVDSYRIRRLVGRWLEEGALQPVA